MLFDAEYEVKCTTKSCEILIVHCFYVWYLSLNLLPADESALFLLIHRYACGDT